MDKFNFDKVINRLETMKSQLPTRLANQAQTHFVQTFDKQGFDNKPWKEVQRRIEGTKAYKYIKPQSWRTSPILVNTGKLWQKVAASIRDVSFSMIRLVVALPYAKYLNEGTGKMVKRHFMGDSIDLRRKHKTKINEEIKKAWHL